MRGLVPVLHQMYEQYRKSVDFLCVYILEAHAQDEWPISSSRYNPTRLPVKYKQPKTNSERLAIATEFIAAYNFRLPTVADCIENEFEFYFAGWPIRFYILQERRLKFVAQPKNCTYYPQDVCQWLDENL